jgi:hypothetical protein
MTISDFKLFIHMIDLDLNDVSKIINKPLFYDNTYLGICTDAKIEGNEFKFKLGQINANDKDDDYIKIKTELIKASCAKLNDNTDNKSCISIEYIEQMAANPESYTSLKDDKFTDLNKDMITSSPNDKDKIQTMIDKVTGLPIVTPVPTPGDPTPSTTNTTPAGSDDSTIVGTIKGAKDAITNVQNQAIDTANDIKNKAIDTANDIKNKAIDAATNAQNDIKAISNAITGPDTATTNAEIKEVLTGHVQLLQKLQNSLQSAPPSNATQSVSQSVNNLISTNAKILQQLTTSTSQPAGSTPAAANIPELSNVLQANAKILSALGSKLPSPAGISPAAINGVVQNHANLLNKVSTQTPQTQQQNANDINNYIGSTGKMLSHLIATANPQP